MYKIQFKINPIPNCNTWSTETNKRKLNVKLQITTISNTFLDKTSKAWAAKAKIKKNIIGLCQVNNILHRKGNSQQTEWEKIFAIY